MVETKDGRNLVIWLEIPSQPSPFSPPLSPWDLFSLTPPRAAVAEQSSAWFVEENGRPANARGSSMTRSKLTPWIRARTPSSLARARPASFDRISVVLQPLLLVNAHQVMKMTFTISDGSMSSAMSNLRGGCIL
jgi:hypothetical protein